MNDCDNALTDLSFSKFYWCQRKNKIGSLSQFCYKAAYLPMQYTTKFSFDLHTTGLKLTDDESMTDLNQP